VEALRHGDVVGLALAAQLLDDRETLGIARREVAAQLARAAFEQPEEGTVLPLLCIAVAGIGFVLRHEALKAFVEPPEEGAAFIDGVERVDDGRAPRNRDAGIHASLAEPVQQRHFALALEAARDCPVQNIVQTGTKHVRGGAIV
jgi:hypothetical protein